MHPHCSLYGMQAFRNLDPLTALMRTADRLHRCGHDLQWYEPIMLGDQVRFHDPHPELVSANPDESAGQWAGDAEAPEWTERDALGFGRHLLRQGQYDLAILEFRRLLYLFRDSDSLGVAYQGLYEAYTQKQDYLGALHVAREAAPLLTDEMTTSIWHYNKGVAYYYLENYSKAVTEWGAAIEGTDPVVANRAPMLIGLASASRFQWDSAAEVFSRIPPSNPYAPYAQQCRELSVQGQHLPSRSPTLAGVFSLVPGGGYLYAGHPRTAFSAFIVNGLFIWGAVRAFDRNDTPVGILMGTLSFGWYTGNIYGGVRTASRRNFTIQKNHLPFFDLGFSF